MEIFSLDKHWEGFLNGGLYVKFLSESDAKTFFELCSNKGIAWGYNGHSLLDFSYSPFVNFLANLEKETAVYGECGMLRGNMYHLDSTFLFTGFERSKNEMKKSDLKTGMRVVTRNRTEYLVMTNIEGSDEVLFIRGGHNIMRGQAYNDDLKMKNGDSAWDVESVYTVDSTHAKLDFPVAKTLLWQRTAPVKELTVSEIEKLLGYPVKIIKEAQ